MLYVSLGAWCQVAQQLKNHTGERFVSSAFDWTVSSLKSVSKIIETDGNHFCEGLSLSKPSNSLICDAYGILYHHEFKRDENNESVWTEEGRNEAKSKLTHKHKSMASKVRSSGQCVTFVRFGGHAEPLVAWPYAKDHAAVQETELNHVVQAIEKEFPDVPFRLLFVTCPTAHLYKVDEAKLDPRIWPLEMRHRHGSDWAGASDDWAQVVARIPNSFEKLSADSARETSPFEGINDDFDLLDMFTKDQIAALNRLISRRLSSYIKIG
ncbi:DUF1796 family putative cysteine peptidase [Pseudomonas cremoricolorata]|uniref:Papain-like cysteine peptidase n=1 Tax=Pseudomonas cremoricolorata TaxID=157783 RepID=A0A089WQW0_9PSED|nr:DUF1796 family putative cysteine peptidase [Pseudomonas cremoricolorata]AIR91645.1 hypothetical protein LK03_21360 [Pseudomonas cremoricolorata]